MGGATADPERRDRMAIAAAPYVHRAAGTVQPGLKQERSEAAKRASRGKFEIEKRTSENSGGAEIGQRTRATFENTGSGEIEQRARCAVRRELRRPRDVDAAPDP